MPRRHPVPCLLHGYVHAWVTVTESIPVCRLRYLGTDDQWGFGLYRAGTEDYEDSILPTGTFTGTPQQALDCALGLYLNDPTAWHTQPLKD